MSEIKLLIKLIIKSNVLTIKGMNMEEEFLIEQKFGKPKVFKVPERYFEHFEQCIISKINETTIADKKRNNTRFWHTVAWAACLIGLTVSTIVYFDKVDIRHLNHHIANAYFDDNQSFINSDYFIDEMSDYAMFDNDDFYSFIADE